MEKQLKKAMALIGSGAIVSLDCKPVDKFGLDGFVVGVSEELLLLHVVDGCTLELNGYMAIRWADIKKMAVKKSFVSRGMRLAGKWPTIPAGIDVSNWERLISSIEKLYPILTIEQSLVDSDCVFIGKEVKHTNKHILLHKLNTDARWIGIEKFKFKNITRIAFDDGYQKLLLKVNEHEAEAK